MHVEITKKFQKQVTNCNNSKVKTEIKNAIEKMIQASSIMEIRNIKN